MSSVPDRTPVVVDASLLVDIAVRGERWTSAAEALRGRPLHAPAHVDVEVMSALARLVRAGRVAADEGRAALDRFRSAPITRHPIPDLLPGAWSRTGSLRVSDALYVELATSLELRVLSVDARLARDSDVVSVVE